MDVQKLYDCYNHSAVALRNVYHVQHQPGSHYAGSVIPQHEHCGLVFTLSGEGQMQFDKAKGVAVNNTVFHGGPGCWHDYATLGEKKWETLVIAYDIVNSSPNAKPGGYHLNSYQTPEIKKLLVQLHNIQKSEDPAWWLRANGIFYHILSEMLSNIMDDRAVDAYALYSSVSAYIEAHCTQDLDMPSVARHFGIKENRLYYIFKKYANAGPAAHLNNCRMKQAAELLKVGKISVQDVAITLGYSDGFSFSKQFKKKYGVAPSFFQKHAIPEMDI